MPWEAGYRVVTSIFRTLLVMALSFVALAAAYFVIDPNRSEWPWAVIYTGLNCGLVYLLQVKWDKKPVSALGVERHLGRPLCVGVVWAVATYTAVLLAGVVYGSVGFAGARVPTAGEPNIFAALVSGGVICLGIALGEELWFRGYLLGFLQERHGVVAAVVTSAIVFSVMHVMDGPRGTGNLLNIVLIGVVFALLRLGTGSLWAPIGFHWAWNWFDMYAAPVGEQGWLQFDALRVGAGPEKDVFSLLAFLALGIFLFIRHREREQPKETPLWRPGAGAVVITWLLVAVAVMGGPMLLHGVPYVVETIHSGQEVPLALLPAEKAILPTADWAANQVRAPLAWQKATGKGMKVLEVVFTAPGANALTEAEARRVLAAVAPDATLQRLVVQNAEASGAAAQGVPDSAAVVQVAHNVQVVALSNAAHWSATVLVDLVRQLVLAGKTVVVGVDGLAEGAERHRISQAGGITVGGADAAGLVADALVLETPADVYAPFGAAGRPAATLVAAGVAALTLEAEQGSADAVDVRKRLVAASVQRWQAVNLQTGAVDMRLYTVNESGAYQAVRSWHGRPAVYRSLDAARSVGIDLPVSWDVNALNVVSAWSKATGRDVRVAIVAEGLQNRRPNLQKRIATWTGFCDRNCSADKSPQGTATGEAIVRLAPGANLIVAMMVEGDVPGRFSAAVKWSVEQGAAVIAIPFGAGMNSAPAHAAINAAVEKGVVVVWPAYSGSNKAVLKPAPLVPFLSPEYPLTGLGVTPELVGQVAGLAALVKEVAPQIGGSELQELLVRTGNQVGNTVVPDALRLVEAIVP